MKRCYYWLFVALLATGCSQQSQTNPKPPEPLSITANETNDLHRMDVAKQLARQDQRVDEATAVIVDRDLSVGLKAGNFNRLFLKDIRKNVHRRLVKNFPRYQVQVTTDNKVFDELKKMESEMRKSTPLSPKAAQQKLEKMNKDMKG